MLPVLPRIPDVTDMIEGEYYFILHAPRQSGKTTFIEALTDKINLECNYYALYCDLSPLRGTIDIDKAVEEIVDLINVSLASSGVDELNKMADTYNSIAAIRGSGSKVRMLLNSICRNLSRELVVFFDEADCLSGPALVKFLTQIRAGYLVRHQRNNEFPRSMALIGMRDIRDYIVQVRPEEASTGLASPFNVKKKALTLANFTQKEIQSLYNQHTEATGQAFDPEAIEKAWHWSEGQPWLVNALAYEVVVEQLKNDYSKAISRPDIDQAAEILIQRRDTHLDSLLERLKEPRVISVMDAVFSGSKGKVPIDSDNRQYCIDLGLVTKNEDGSLRPANGIYKEVITRVITDQVQYVIGDYIKIKKWTDGKVLFMSDLLKDFQRFLRHDSDSFPFNYKEFAAYKYDEATYAFILQAFLQKIVNGEAKVHRGFAEGSGRVDLAILYNGREYLLEVKLEYAKLEDSLEQLAGYLDNNGEKEGWLVIFDRDVRKSWEEKIYWDTKQIGNLTIHVVGC
jgi:hypothetical protein